MIAPFPGAPDACVYFEARRDSRAVPVIPWNGRYLIGTTDDRYDGDPGTVRGTAEEVEYLLDETNALIPSAGPTPDHVLLTYAGVRPLPYRADALSGGIPRSHLIVTRDEAPGLVGVVGGKLTPHLSLGRQAVDLVAGLLGRTLPPSRADRVPLPEVTTSSVRERLLPSRRTVRSRALGGRVGVSRGGRPTAQATGGWADQGKVIHRAVRRQT